MHGRLLRCQHVPTVVASFLPLKQDSAKEIGGESESIAKITSDDANVLTSNSSEKAQH